MNTEQETEEEEVTQADGQEEVEEGSTTRLELSLTGLQGEGLDLETKIKIFKVVAYGGIALLILWAWIGVVSSREAKECMTRQDFDTCYECAGYDNTIGQSCRAVLIKIGGKK
jgi:hypothetical protein